MEIALRTLLPQMLTDGTSFEVYPSNGKLDLLSNLANRLRGYQSWIPDDWRVVVVVDRDDDNCAQLKSDLERIAQDAGLRTKSTCGNSTWHFVSRIAIEELEAWFWGDMNAVRAAYPRIPATIERQAQYRDPDAIRGGTWEALERILKRAGYFSTGLRKLEATREISQHMIPAKNQSKSFNCFRDLISSLRSAV